MYAGVQGISHSSNYVYIKATGLATNTMGPWFLNAARTTPFPSFPGNAAILYRFPHTVSYPQNYAPASRTCTNIGTCGLFVDGVPFSTPSLRNIALTAPYMHDGRFATLEEVIAHYNLPIPLSETLDPNLAKHPQGLGLSRDDQAALVAFLKTLSDPALIIGP